MANDLIDGGVGTADVTELNSLMGALEQRTNRLAVSANGFASAMGRAFSSSIAGGKQFDDVLKSLALRLSNMALTAAFRPLAQGLLSGVNSLFAGLFGNGATVQAAMGAIKPFAAGGVIGTPTYFPLASGGAGLAGEAGPEAILPLQRGNDGRLGVAMSGGASANVTINIATPDAESFRRSETYLAGQIARAVARGQRSL
jgi:phage-related minor tail protein